MKHVLSCLVVLLALFPVMGAEESLDFDLQISPYGGTYVIPLHAGEQYISHSEIFGQVVSIVFTNSIEHNLAWCAKITFKENTTGTNLTTNLIIKYKNTAGKQFELKGRYSQNRQSVIPGGISPTGNPNVSAGQAPPNLYNAMSPIYAQGLTAVFIWQMAPINKNLWQDIPGTNQASYQPPVLYNSTRYRRGVKVSAYPDIAYSNEIQCLVSTVLSSGIIAKDQTIDFGESCNIESYEEAQGVDFAYQWQWDYGEGWQTIPGETKETLETAMLEQDTKFRRLAVSNSFTAYSNIIQVSVGLFGGQIEHFRWSLDTDIVIGANAPCKGGNLDFTYQWQFYDGSEWQNIPGQTTETYTCPPLTTKKIIRRMVKCGQKETYSTECTIMPFSEFRGNFIITQTATAPAATDADYISDIAYFDGLGRHEMSVSKGASANGGDVIKPTYYDHAGRDNAREYLPFVRNDATGDYLPDVFEYQRAYFAKVYPGDESYAFQETIFEPSELDRPLAAYNAGSIFHNKNKKTRFDYDTNSASDRVFHLKFNANRALDVLGFIPDNTLYRNIVENEDDGMIINLTDQLGRKILERTIDRHNNSSSMDTYYVYDDRDRLCVVISPQGSIALRSGQHHALGEELIDKYCYYYLHDEASRIVERKLPGKSIEYLIYDKGDRLVMSQDGNQRKQQEWTYYVYDNFNRLISMSLVKQQITLSRQDIQNRYNAVEFNNSYPTLGGSPNKYKPFADNTFVLLAILSESRYGNSDTSFTIPDYLDPKPIAGIISIDVIDNRMTGLKSYDKIAITDASGNNDINYVERAYYYDYHGRLVQCREFCDVWSSCSSYKYDFRGNLLASITSQRMAAADSEDVLEYQFTYDTRGRLLSQNVTLNGSTPAKVTYSYDELGRLAMTNYGEGVHTQSVTQNYDLRNWLTGQSCNAFSMLLRYHNPQQAATTPSYTSNITEWTFRHGSDPQTTYAFSYDALSRLTASRQYENGTASEQFVEKGITYDHNGNILTLQRTASGTLADDLTYTYTGNQLATLSGSVSASFVYDANGNMIQDGANDLEISYNRLNLIEKVSRNGEILANYAYLSDGTKLSAMDADGNGLYYAGSLVYRKQNGIMSLESAGFNGGRFVATNNGAEPYYFISDHLGSVRAVINANGEVVERNDYYPFGLRWNEANSMLSDNRYRYNGKEEQSFINIPYIDYGARMYDPKFRLSWNASDPLVEKYYPVSTYAYCFNNPIKYIDPDGQKALVSINDKAQIVTIHANIYINSRDYSPTRLRVLSQQYQTSIENAWDKNWTYSNNGIEYQVKFKVAVMPGSSKQRSTAYDNFIVIKDGVRSFVRETFMGVWDGKRDASVHEFGHIIGLPDQYRDVQGEDGKVKSIANDGWENNIMGSPNGEVEQRNIDNVLNNAFQHYNKVNETWWRGLFEKSREYLIKNIIDIKK